LAQGTTTFSRPAIRGDEEQRPVYLYGVVSHVGRSYGFVDCPFCHTTVRVYLWSLAGSGKRCPCGALLTSSTAFK
jgi:hypothetical protein